MMHSWFFSASLSLICFGFWGILSKLSTNYIDVRSAFFFQALGAGLTAIMALWWFQQKPQLNFRGDLFGLLTGIINGIGCILFLVSIQRGKTAAVVAYTSLYPAITLVLAYVLLHEALNTRQLLGVGFAMLAVSLLA